jgi:MOSC domain-containing protein YiiM
MWKGELVSIFISSKSGEDMQEISTVEAIAGRGLKGDRFFAEDTTDPSQYDPSREITLIEIETFQAVENEYGIKLGLAESRRNLITCGVPLNHLVDKEFTVGQVHLRGLRLCEPCEHLASMTQKEVLPALIHRGGLRAQIIRGGRITVGDTINMLTL